MKYYASNRLTLTCINYIKSNGNLSLCDLFITYSISYTIYCKYLNE